MTSQRRCSPPERGRRRRSCGGRTWPESRGGSSARVVLFVGRNTEGTAVVSLSDVDGRPGLRLQVDSLGNASIAFLDTAGRVLRAIAP